MPSLEENIDAIVSMIGTEHVGIVWGLANQNWASAAERDQFVKSLKRPQEG
jgi:hypothetical protein